MLMQNQNLRRAEEIVSRFDKLCVKISASYVSYRSKIQFNNHNTVINLMELNFIGVSSSPA